MPRVIVPKAAEVKSTIGRLAGLRALLLMLQMESSLSMARSRRLPSKGVGTNWTGLGQAGVPWAIDE